MPDDVLYDLFISYTHGDDDDPAAWVEALEEGLKARASALKGVRLRVFRDVDRTRSGPLGELMKILEQSRSLLVVHSRRYLESEFCPREVSHFTRHWGNRAIFKVEKLWVDPLDQHEDLQDHAGYEFWTGTKAKPRELLGEELQYFRALTALAYDVCRVLYPDEAETKGRVLLLHAGGDRTEERNTLKTQLEGKGYLVQMPARLARLRDAAQLEEIADDMNVAVVLFGQNHSEDLEADFNLVSSRLPTIASFPEGKLDERQQRLFDAIERAQDETRRVRLWPPPFDGIESEIESLIPRNNSDPDKPVIYLSALESSLDFVASLRARIETAGFKVTALTDEPGKLRRMERHNRAMKNANGVLILPSTTSAEFAPNILHKILEAEAKYGRYEKAFISSKRRWLPDVAASYTAFVEEEPGFDEAIRKFLERVRSGLRGPVAA